MRVFVSVGTDHHRFDRLVDWIDAWTLNNPNHDVIVQHGYSREPERGTAVRMLSVESIGTEFAAADLVIVSCGPGAIMDSRQSGRRPVVVPRLADLNECVDDHQVTFGTHMSRQGMVWCALSEAELHELMDSAQTEPERFMCEIPSAAPPAAAEVFGNVVESVVRAP